MTTVVTLHSLIFLLKTLQEEVEGYVESVEKLGQVAQSLILNDHFDSVNINARKVSIVVKSLLNIVLKHF